MSAVLHPMGSVLVAMSDARNIVSRPGGAQFFSDGQTMAQISYPDGGVGKLVLAKL